MRDPARMSRAELEIFYYDATNDPDACGVCHRHVGQFNLGMLGACRECTERMLKEMWEIKCAGAVEGRKRMERKKRSAD